MKSSLESLIAPRSMSWLDANAIRLFVCGLAALFWELVLIRWLGTSIRIVAYFSNLVLISAFFGLGVGALMTRFQSRMERMIAPLAALATMLGVWMGRLFQMNPGGDDVYIWLGAPSGVTMPEWTNARIVSSTLVLIVVYAVTAVLFAAFGQYMGRLFKTHPPLRAYSLEVAGSLAGIGLFAVLSHYQTSPTIWFVAGFALLFLLLLPRLLDSAVILLLGTGVVLLTLGAVSGYVWSPYYRISLGKITQVFERGTNRLHEFGRTVGYYLTVNTDYHQMILDLRPGGGESEHAFLRGWRNFYDAPYRGSSTLPPGPILVVGAGTGNDVSAALRNTDRRVTAVEIDPAIADIGRSLHPEKPYQNSRVALVIDDARSFFHRSPEKYALVVFGFLDSHRLLSSFSSVRLDNFIYTRESMAEVRNLLVPGGRVALSFASNRPWIHDRILKLLNESFDYDTSAEADGYGYANGILYSNGLRTSSLVGGSGGRAGDKPNDALVPTDDWPFLYLRARTIPVHNMVFLAVAVLLSGGAFLLLPRGERRIRLPYFFLGAAFFLLETSNVVRMSLLYGSTWWVNTVVFAGILSLVLLSNLTAAFWRVPVIACLAALGVGILLAVWIPSGALLDLPPVPRAVLSVGMYLGPVYFGGLIFARLIEREKLLFEAYGSNVLGAVVGGTGEYLSLVMGFRFLFALALAFYLIVLLLLHRSRMSI